MVCDVCGEALDVRSVRAVPGPGATGDLFEGLPAPATRVAGRGRD
jgi:hypothetical protein